MLQNAIVKEGRFLLEKQGEASADGGETKWALNGNLVESLLTVRAKYVLSTMLALIVKPQLETATAATARPKLVEFEDLDAQQAEWLYELLVYMCKSGEFTHAHPFILELESRYMLQSPGDADMKTWSSMWTEVIERALVARKRHAKSKGKDEAVDLGKTLPASKMVINKSFPKEATAASAAASAESGEVKEENNPSEQAEQGQQSQQEHTVQPAVPYFQSIYTATAQEGTIHTLDVLAVQTQVQNMLFMRAGWLNLHLCRLRLCVCVCVCWCWVRRPSFIPGATHPRSCWQ